MLPIIPKDSAARLLASSIPEAEWFLSQIESKQGWFRFPPILTNAIRNLKIESYPLLYENEHAIARMLQLAFFSQEEAEEFNLEFEMASLEGRGAMLEEFSANLDKAMDSFEIPKTPKQQEAAKARFDALSKEEQAEAILFAQRWHCFFFPNFFSECFNDGAWRKAHFIGGASQGGGR
jgi:hypothetical protein